MDKEEDKYPEISKMLKSLPKVSAGDDFLLKLHRKIGNIEKEPLRKSGESSLGRFFENFRSLWVAPALGLAVVLIFATYFIFKSLNDNTGENLSNQNTESKPGTTNQENLSKMKEEKSSPPVAEFKDTASQNKNFAAIPESDSKKKFSNKKESFRYSTEMESTPPVPAEMNRNEVNEKANNEANDKAGSFEKPEDKDTELSQDGKAENNKTGISPDETGMRGIKTAEENSAKDDESEKDTSKISLKKKLKLQQKADSLNLESLKVKINENK